MNLSRRKILGGLAAAPVVAPAMAEQAKMGMLGRLGMGGLVGGSDCSPPSSGGMGVGEGPMRFFSFPDWLKHMGDRRIREAARAIHGFDPDLIERRLPIATKVRIQRERNYRRELEERRQWFEDRLSVKGVVEWWG